MTNTLPDPTYEQLERGLSAWARSREDILAILVIGSRARELHPADVYSDLDTILFVSNPAVFSAAGAWQAGLEAAFGIPAWFAAFGWTMGDPEWEYVLEDGRKVDMVFTVNRARSMPDEGGQQQPRQMSTPPSAASAWEMAAASPFRFVFERGARVLFDRNAASGGATRGGRIAYNDYAQNVQAAGPSELPDQPAFDNRIANTLLELVRAAKIGRRGEHYRAARILNEEMQENLLALAELHAQGQQRPGAGFWRYGRFLEEWADPRVVKDLPDTHAQPAPDSIRRAVLAGLALLEWLGPETAALLGLRFPQAMVQPTAGWLRKAVIEWENE